MNVVVVVVVDVFVVVVVGIGVVVAPSCTFCLSSPIIVVAVVVSPNRSSTRSPLAARPDPKELSAL